VGGWDGGPRPRGGLRLGEAQGDVLPLRGQLRLVNRGEHRPARNAARVVLAVCARVDVEKIAGL
jgi:hypothetical protein